MCKPVAFVPKAEDEARAVGPVLRYLCELIRPDQWRYAHLGADRVVRVRHCLDDRCRRSALGSVLVPAFKLFWPRRAWMACMIPFAGVSAVVPTLEGLRVLNARRLRARGVDAVVPVAIDPKVRFSEGRDMPPTRAHLDPTRPVINSSACVLSHRSQSLLSGFVTATARSAARTLATRQCCPMGAIHGPL